MGKGNSGHMMVLDFLDPCKILLISTSGCPSHTGTGSTIMYYVSLDGGRLDSKVWWYGPKVAIFCQVGLLNTLYQHLVSLVSEEWDFYCILYKIVKSVDKHLLAPLPFTWRWRLSKSKRFYRIFMRAGIISRPSSITRHIAQGTPELQPLSWPNQWCLSLTQTFMKLSHYAYRHNILLNTEYL